jgi:hypothetical protein
MQEGWGRDGGRGWKEEREREIKKEREQKSRGSFRKTHTQMQGWSWKSILNITSKHKETTPLGYVNKEIL